jgi:hypothetical protein
VPCFTLHFSHAFIFRPFTLIIFQRNAPGLGRLQVDCRVDGGPKEQKIEIESAMEIEDGLQAPTISAQRERVVPWSLVNFLFPFPLLTLYTRFLR